MEMADKVPDTKLAQAIRSLQNEIEEKYTILKALRTEFNPEDINYYAYVKNEAWQAKRLSTFRRDGFRCVICGESKNLNCHHITYENLGVEENSDLVTLCEICHEKVHSGNSVERLLNDRRLDLADIERALKAKEQELRERNQRYQIEKYFENYDQMRMFAAAILLGDDYFFKLNDEEKIGRYCVNWFRSELVNWLNNGNHIEDFEDKYSDIDFSKLPLLAFDNMPSERIGKIELYLRYLAHCGYSQTSHYLDIGYKSGGKEDKELNSKNEFYKKLIYDFGYLEQKARDIAER